MAHSGTDSVAQLRHLALFYASTCEYVEAVQRQVCDAASNGERVLVAVPEQHAQALRPVISVGSYPAALIDMPPNPARILPAIQEFLRGGAPATVISELIWTGRTRDETREATRHEALINLAFSEARLTIVCPYDAASLPASVIKDACRTHPWTVSRGRQQRSPTYAGPLSVPVSCDLPLPPPPARAEVIAYESDLREMRSRVANRVHAAGLPASRTVDLVLAVSEVAANTLRHTRTGGTVRIWLTAREIICQVEDAGHITDPLAGRRAPDPDRNGGYGLWLVNKSCDLTEMRTSQSGTTTRLHMRLANSS